MAHPTPAAPRRLSTRVTCAPAGCSCQDAAPGRHRVATGGTRHAIPIIRHLLIRLLGGRFEFPRHASLSGLTCSGETDPSKHPEVVRKGWFTKSLRSNGCIDSPRHACRHSLCATGTPRHAQFAVISWVSGDKAACLGIDFFNRTQTGYPALELRAILLGPASALRRRPPPERQLLRNPSSEAIRGARAVS